jgi:hypothetical protein
VIVDAGDRAHAGEVLSVPGHEEDAIFVPDVDRERHGHRREHDRVFQRYQ